MEIHDRGIVAPATQDERTAIAHLRQWCHDASICPICKAERRAYQAELTLNQIIEG